MEEILHDEIKMVLDSYIQDPADSPFQRGYLAAFLNLNENLGVVSLSAEEEETLYDQCKGQTNDG